MCSTDTRAGRASSSSPGTSQRTCPGCLPIDREPFTQDGGVQDPARRGTRGRDLEAVAPERGCELEAKRWSRTPGVNLKAK